MMNPNFFFNGNNNNNTNNFSNSTSGMLYNGNENNNPTMNSPVSLMPLTKTNSYNSSHFSNSMNNNVQTNYNTKDNMSSLLYAFLSRMMMLLDCLLWRRNPRYISFRFLWWTSWTRIHPMIFSTLTTMTMITMFCTPIAPISHWTVLQVHIILPSPMRHWMILLRHLPIPSA